MTMLPVVTGRSGLQHGRTVNGCASNTALGNAEGADADAAYRVVWPPVRKPDLHLAALGDADIEHDEVLCLPGKRLAAQGGGVDDNLCALSGPELGRAGEQAETGVQAERRPGSQPDFVPVAAYPGDLAWRPGKHAVSAAGIGEDDVLVVLARAQVHGPEPSGEFRRSARNGHHDGRPDGLHRVRVPRLARLRRCVAGSASGGYRQGRHRKRHYGQRLSHTLSDAAMVDPVAPGRAASSAPGSL